MKLVFKKKIQRFDGVLTVKPLAFIIAGLILVFAQSCLKSSAEYDETKRLRIVFNSQTISFNQLDSASVVFTKQGSNTGVFKRLQKSLDLLETDIEDLSAGTWNAEIYLNTKKDTAGKSSQYKAKLNFSIEQISGILMPAPAQQSTELWKKRIVLATSQNEIVVTIPLDVTDPYFEIITKELRWDSFSIERAAFRRANNMNEQLGAQTWTCTSNCMGNDKIIFNSTAFAQFSETMKSKPWNNADVSITIKDEDAQLAYEFYHAWDK
jgi:hypothetical protein